VQTATSVQPSSHGKFSTKLHHVHADLFHATADLAGHVAQSIRFGWSITHSNSLPVVLRYMRGASITSMTCPVR